jgi:hypothetical protein
MQGSFPLTKSVYGFGLQLKIGRKVQRNRENYLSSPPDQRNVIERKFRITGVSRRRNVRHWLWGVEGFAPDLFGLTSVSGIGTGLDLCDSFVALSD